MTTLAETAHIKSDYELTGKLYDKLDAYLISHRPESEGVYIYMGSSCQFKTMKKYKALLLAAYGDHLDVRIVKA